MKRLAAGIAVLALVAVGRPALADGCQPFRPSASFGPVAYFGYSTYAVPVPVYPYPTGGYVAFASYPYPLPLAPSFGFGQGGLYGHEFVPRDETIVGYTLPGGR